MSKVEEIKQAIDTLPEKDYVLLRQWFSEKDWHKWDAQIAEDSKSGKLDFYRRKRLRQKQRIKSGNFKCIEQQSVSGNVLKLFPILFRKYSKIIIDESNNI